MNKKNILRRCFALLCAVLILAACAPAALAASCTAKINSSASKVFKSPSTDSELLGEGGRNITVEMTAYSNGWAKISYKGHTGYIQAQYLTLESRIKAYTTKSSPVYSLAEEGSSLGTLDVGSTVYVVGMEGKYCEIENSSGSARGFIRSDNLSTRRPRTQSSSVSSLPESLRSSVSVCSAGLGLGDRIEYAIYLGDTLVGTRYSAQNNPTHSFDNSGFVHYCLTQAGIDVRDSAYRQGYDKRMEKIEGRSALERGDIVCFNTNPNDDDRSDHTGIYLGDGYFLHASAAAGKVLVSTLDSGYYADTFSWARRPV